MPNPQLIGPIPQSTPAELRSSSRGRSRDLPPDLLREASRRLGIISLLAAVLWLVATVFGHLAYRAMSHSEVNWMQLSFPDAVSVVAVIVSLALFAYTRRSRRSPRFILDLGLGYLIFTALALSVTLHSGGTAAASYVFPMITWVGVAVIMFAAIVPSTPRKTFIASLIAASMNPISMLVEKANGTWDFGPWTNALVMHYPDLLLVGVAVVISHVVTRLGQQVTKAREMGSYHLGELLGSGGMGEVYKATHRMLARPAAIKLIRPEMLGAGTADEAKITVARFRREAEAAANLRSPHTVEVYDFGVTEDETIYIVMELLEGLDLESLVRKQGPLPANRVIHVLRQVCDSLEEAHIYGLVHRDIKPANIHLGRVGLRHDFVKVLDFGLVKAVADTTVEQPLVTVPGQMALGTPAYMSPEMALGEMVDGRADIYALGCVAYFLLTGQLVFQADKAFQMIAKHLQTIPVPPSELALHVPPTLERLVLSCLAKDPKGRPQSAGELARSLALIDVNPWSEEEATQWWAVNRPA
ncbi:MAG: eukaryotic-like serine/threonine-protein kinase [Gemmatimonadaceae bacterium]|nr:eukaryotic-like serine/threonine-protein kinase [Gemmatimonadaceae bacterium]